ncbi:hypothetical protein HD553DRAFT_46881 [Filobasidium floriforme]|uniref:uncharacterized protein n=1 Tax=Filobasidium floriforme TaxID=5210 RepID=UPI001E8ED7E5|nr:uncharacterized protein HD553DRAFT_46881 [Filobasidium floriforme]KAH8083547.1 hypothetical protein HD553DRAFT_46881 [Filobasidium floriforme]
MSDVPLAHSVGPLIWENDLIRSEILGYLSDPIDFLNSGLVGKMGFKDAMRLLWKDATLGQVNWLYIEDCDCDRLSMYLRAIQRLTVLDDSLDRRELYDETDDTIKILYPSVKKPIYSGHSLVRQEGDIVLFQAWHATFFSFRGIELMPHLETLEVESCPSKTHAPYFENDVSMKVVEEYQLGGRKINVITHYTASGMVDWDRPMIDIANTSSYVKSIQVGRPEPGQWESQTIFIDGSLNSHLQHLEVFKMDDAIACGELHDLLRACRSLKSLDVILYPSHDDGYAEEPESLLAFLAISPLMIEDVSIRCCPIEWLPYFRHCKNLRLRSHAAFRIDRPGLPRIEWSTSTKEAPTTKRLALQVSRIRDEDVTAFRDFIRCHAAAETRIEVCHFIEGAPVLRVGSWDDALGRLTSNANADADSTVSDEAET